MAEEVIAGDAHPGGSGAQEGPEARRRLIPPPTRWQFAVLMVALLYLAGSVGYLLGSRRPSRPGMDSVDVGFLYDMIVHHEQAVAMSDLELANGDDRRISGFAREILKFQAYEMGLMQQQLAAWGLPATDPKPEAMEWMGMPMATEQMTGMASDAELAALTDARGRDADALFVPLMQDHHRGGVHMAEYAADHAESEFVRSLATRMAHNQRIEVNELEQARVRAGLPESPPGYQPAQVVTSPADDHLREAGDHQHE